MSKIANDGLTRSGLTQDAFYTYNPYGNSGRQRVNISNEKMATATADTTR